MSEGNKKYDLEERLIQFALLIIDIVEMLPNTRAGNHIAGQLIRSGTSPVFNYGEAQERTEKRHILQYKLSEENPLLKILQKLIKVLPNAKN